jgi:hypothetical protein
MRRLNPPTLAQWGCQHRWKTTTSRPGGGDILRVRYLTCRRCGLKLKTEERLAVPWDEGDLVAQVKALLPEGQAVALRDKGITELPLAALNARLAPHGYVIRASKGRDSKRIVACMGEDGRVEQYGLFALLPMPPEAPGPTNKNHPRKNPIPDHRGIAGSRKKGRADEAIVIARDEPIT